MPPTMLMESGARPLRGHDLKFFSEPPNSLPNPKLKSQALLTREQGKTYPESLNEARLTASVFKYYAGLAPTISGRKVELADPTEFGMVFKQSMGVTVAIAPWNSPVILMGVKLAPALAAGNTIVAKPASSTPLADLLMWSS